MALTHARLAFPARAESESEEESGASNGDEMSCRPLSAKELDVIRLLANGKSNKEIAALLNLSTRTVETYRARLMFKLGIHSLAELIQN
jgi:DNA-binding NarL/FixJ family response regulator